MLDTNEINRYMKTLAEENNNLIYMGASLGENASQIQPNQAGFSMIFLNSA